MKRSPTEWEKTFANDISGKGIQQFHCWEFIRKTNENTNLKIYMHPNVHCNIIYNIQNMEAT